MKKIILFAATAVSLISFSFLLSGDKGTDSLNNVVLQFITTNLMSNNLFIDNITIGARYDYDIAPVSVNNIAKDTSYSVNGNNSFQVTPRITFLNEGRQNVSASFNVTLKITPGTYTSVKQISSLANRRAIEVSFDSLTLSPNVNYTIKAWSSLSNEQNTANDTLTQTSLYLPGAKRNVLFEEYTNVSCPACGVNDPYLDTFIVSRFDTIVAIKYHTWWPASNDPMYTPNIPQIRNRVNYYPLNNVPVLNVDGYYLNIYPYTNFLFMYTPYRNRLSNGSPLGVSVTDTRIAGDTIKSDIALTIYSALPAGNYRMRVNAVERHIHYANPPGSNGEKEFYDVFRYMFPDTNGIAIPTTVGTYNYTIKYLRQTAWVDSMIYTAVFVQNDVNREVLNCAKARHFADNISQRHSSGSLNPLTLKQSNNPAIKLSVNETDTGGQSFNLEPFEVSLVPPGWSITNTDAVTFNLCNIANGPSFGGTKSIQMLLVSANWTTPSYHTLKSKVFNNINLTDSIKFDWAYAPYGGESVEGLKVQLSTDGGSTFPYTIFNKVGSQLATAPETGEAFVPADSSQWRTFGCALGDAIGIKKISSQVPAQFSLSQNYPNPFNPSTKIKFSLPHPSEGGEWAVQLNVYDLLGRKVASLIPPLRGGKEGLSPGTYEVEWNATNFSSGVYFYKLVAGDFVQTRKMILLK